MQHALFSADASVVDRAMLDSFLALDLPESYTVEYKSAADKSVLEAVASMANTYGGMVLVGITDRPGNKDRPGEPKGVPVADREPLINQMATMFAPAWWTPEVVAVPVAEGRDVLVIRVDTATAPRPLFYQYRVPIRLEGRKAHADLGQILRLVDESGTRPMLDVLPPNHPPSGPHHVTGVRIDDPAVVVRAFTPAPVLRRMTRPRIDHRAHQAMLAGLGRSRLRMTALGLGAQLATGRDMFGWQVHQQITTTRVVRQWMGHQYTHPDWPLPHGPFQGDRPEAETAVRAQCFAAINGIDLEMGVDVALWVGDQAVKVEWRQLERCAYDVVHALAGMHQELLGHILGQGSYALPTVELHIETGVNPRNAIQNYNRPEESPIRRQADLEEVVDTLSLGPNSRHGGSTITRGSENLPHELVAQGDLDGAVGEALDLMVMDWGYLKRRD